MEYRLNKYISSSGFCSRREADRFIEEGKVRVDGKRAEIGARVYPKQKVTVNGVLIKHEQEPVYIALNKPVGIVSTTDPEEKSNIVDFVCHEQRIFPIGRLDKDSQGLILLTNDGDIVNKILRAGNNHVKEYIVTVDRPITEEFLVGMTQGVPILDRVTRKCEIEQINPYTFKIGLIQGLNRQIRRMCAYFDYEVLKLERTKIMNISLGKLGEGNWRDLTPHELEELFDLLEDSQKIEKRRGKTSNKAINRELEQFDIQTDYRKGGLAQKNMKLGKKKGKKIKGGNPFAQEGPRRKKSTKGSGPRIGKQRPDKVKKRNRR